MRILGVGQTCDLGAMYAGFARRGHATRVHIADARSHDVYAGAIERIDDWEAQLGWVREAGRDGLVVFETASHGVAQDALRREGFRVIGGSAFGDRLEGDRAFGQQVLRDAGLATAASHPFDDAFAALDFLERRPGRYVLKFNGTETDRTLNYVGTQPDGRDLRAMLSLLARRMNGRAVVDFVLMEYVCGVEVGVGAYFDGRSFLQPACIDFEHKRFFNGDLGELTGEMGTIVSYRRSRRLLDATLGRVAERLAGSGYVGYINLNLIANDDGLWPLEFTSRFGYPGFAICEALHEEPWEAIFARMLDREGRDAATFATKDGFAAGVVLTVPPFPYREGYASLSKGLPIGLDDGRSPDEEPHLHLAEAAFENDLWVTAGTCGYVGVATGVGPDVTRANDAALALARRVVLPNLRYRTDIGQRLVQGGWAELRRLGWLD